MSDTPTQRELPPELDGVPAAHERRARLIAHLHEQAMAKASDLSNLAKSNQSKSRQGCSAAKG